VDKEANKMYKAGKRGGQRREHKLYEGLADLVLENLKKNKCERELATPVVGGSLGSQSAVRAALKWFAQSPICP
jgi:hypothetical protein